MRYAVDTDTLRDGADAVDEALQRLEKLGLAQVMGSVAAGLPRGRVADTVGALGSAWESRLADTRWMLRSLGGQLVAAAESYDAVERMVERVVERVADDRATDHRARVGGR